MMSIFSYFIQIAHYSVSLYSALTLSQFYLVLYIWRKFCCLIELNNVEWKPKFRLLFKVFAMYRQSVKNRYHL